MKVQYNLRIMPQFFGNLLRALRERRGTDMLFMCRHLLSERGEASQTALAQEIINAYRAMNDKQRLKFYEMLSRDFAPDQASILSAAADYQSSPDLPLWPPYRRQSNLRVRNCSAVSIPLRAAPKLSSPCVNTSWRQ